MLHKWRDDHTAFDMEGQVRDEVEFAYIRVETIERRELLSINQPLYEETILGMKIEPGICEEVNTEKREVAQEKGLWYMQRLGPRIKAKLR